MTDKDSLASVYNYDSKKYLIFAYAKAGEGLWAILDEPITVLDVHSTDEEIGDNIFKILEYSSNCTANGQRGLPAITAWEIEIGKRGWPQFIMKSQAVRIAFSAREKRFWFNRYYGGSKGLLVSVSDIMKSKVVTERKDDEIYGSLPGSAASEEMGSTVRKMTAFRQDALL